MNSDTTETNDKYVKYLQTDYVVFSENIYITERLYVLINFHSKDKTENPNNSDLHYKNISINLEIFIPLCINSKTDKRI